MCKAAGVASAMRLNSIAGRQRQRCPREGGHAVGRENAHSGLWASQRLLQIGVVKTGRIHGTEVPAVFGGPTGGTAAAVADGRRTGFVMH